MEAEAMGLAKAKRRQERWRRKNIVIDQRKMNRAKTSLKVATETDAIDAALDLVVFEGEVLGGIDRLVRVGGLADPL